MSAAKSKKKAKKSATAKSAAATVLQLDKELNIKGVVELKQKLAATLKPGQPINIDTAAVNSVDTAALQLLVAFARHAKTQSSTISWVNTSAAFVDAAHLLDLDQHLGLAAAAA